MLNKLKVYLKNFDWVLFCAVVLLSLFGLIEIYSIALGQETLDLLNFKKQILFIISGVGLLFIFSFIDYHFFKGFSNYFYIFGALILIAVIFFGQTVRGTTGWFYLGGFTLQPVEFVKIILIIFLARFFSMKSVKIRPFKHFLISGLGTLVFVFLVLAQPDFGSALLLAAVWIIMLMVTGFNKKYFLVLGMVALVLVALAWNFFFKDYQKQRIMTFFNPSAYSLEEGYNIRQAIIAVGSGGVIGRGVGFGSQSQLKFLPEAQNDFIFAVISEELGFLGVCLIMAFFLIFFFRCLNAVKKINNDFGIYFILGAVGLIFIEMFINIGMNIGLMPVVGISLPFISYGGSSILSSFILVGIIENIIIKSKVNY